MRNLKLLSTIALSCLVAGFVSCSQTGIDVPVVEPNNDVLYIVSAEANASCPKILSDFLQQGYRAVVCEANQADQMIQRTDPAGFYYFIGADFQKDKLEAMTAEGRLRAKYIGNTDLYLKPEVYAALNEAGRSVRAGSEALISTDPACYQSLKALSADQMAQFESLIAEKMYEQKPTQVRIARYGSMTEFLDSECELARLSDRDIALMAYSDKSFPVHVCAAPAVRADDDMAAAMAFAAKSYVFSEHWLMPPVYREQGYTFVSRDDVYASVERKSPDFMLRQVGLKDMVSSDGGYSLGVNIELRGLVYLKSSGDSAVENPGYMREISTRLGTLFKVLKLDKVPLTLTAQAAFATIGDFDELSGKAGEELIASLEEATFAASNQTDDAPKVRFSPQFSQFYMTTDTVFMSTSRPVYNQFDSYIVDQLSTGKTTEIRSVTELEQIKQRSGENSEAFFCDILPAYYVRNVHIISESVSFKSESSSEDYFASTMQECMLKLLHSSDVPSTFLDNDRQIDGSSLFEYTVDGDNYYTSLMDAIRSAAASGDFVEIGTKLRTPPV